MMQAQQGGDVAGLGVVVMGLDSHGVSNWRGLGVVKKCSC